MRRAFSLLIVIPSLGLSGCLLGRLTDRVGGGGTAITVQEVDFRSQVADSVQLKQVEKLFRQNNLGLEGLVLTQFEIDDLGFTHLRFNQLVKDLPVFHQEILYHFDPNGNLSSVTGGKVEAVDVSTTPELTKEAAAKVAFQEMVRMKGEEPLADLDLEELVAELGYYDPSLTGREKKPNLILVWKIGPKERSYPLVFVDAVKGSVVYRDSGIRY